MRILSWNINGIRTLPQYHPWNTFKSCEEILDHMGADIICFQEMKTSRSALDKNVGMPGRFHAFFSFPASKGGYSGVAVYTDSRTVVPLKAEEGLSGHLQPKPPLTAEEMISGSYPSAYAIDLMADAQGNKPADLAILDTEGRALVLDLGLFVLINLYCPVENSDERLVFKMNFHLTLEERVKRLIEDGREVIVLGDINICASPLDHGEGHLASRAVGFYDHPARNWFRKWLEPEGPMVDVVRKFWPGRKGMYTCWNTKISARETNYGARVDYILSTRGLLPWFKHGDIQPSLKGSDHCPIYVDLHDEITLPSGATLTLRDAMHVGDSPREPPRLASKYWDEYSGKQTLLSTFFGKRGNVPPPREDTVRTTSRSSSPPALSQSQTSRAQSKLSSQPSETPTQTSSSLDEPPPPSSPPLSILSSPSQSIRKSSPLPIASSSSTNRSLRKRKSDIAEHSRGKPKKLKSGQTKLSTFFSKPPATRKKKTLSSEAELIEGRSLKQDDLVATVPSLVECDDIPVEVLQEYDASEHSIIQESSSQSKAAWSQLLGPIKPPKCIVHGEPAKEYTVNKPGPNKGKNFFICSRPVGPGYDKGRSERLREEINPVYKCNFFRWSSEVKRESMRMKKDAT